MTAAILFAFASAIFLGAGVVTAQFGLRTVEPLSAAAISIPSFTLLFLLACSLRDLWRPLTDMLAPPATPRRVAPVVALSPAMRASQVLAWALCRRGPPQ